MFSRSEWSVVRNALLAKGGTLKKRTSSHLHKVSTWRRVHELCKQPLYSSQKPEIWSIKIHVKTLGQIL
jgi:hypothetical protein